MGIVKSKKVITQKTESVLALLSRQDFCRNFYLAGGTGLALLLNHRKSVDLDFFTAGSFNPKILSVRLKKIFKENFRVLNIEKGTLNVLLNKVHTSFMEFKYPMITPPKLNNYGIYSASIEDIAAMKISTVTGRSARKDLIDIYYIIQSGINFDEIIGLFCKKFGKSATDPIIIYKSLNYFENADDERMPYMFDNISWEKIKKFISRQTAIYFKNKFL